MFGVPADVAEIAHALQGHGDALQPVGDLDRYRVELNAAGLLEISELGDFLSVQPDFPTQAPGAQGGRFPVVFDEADVVLARVDPQRFQRFQVQFLRVARVGLEDHLELVMLLQAVGVFAVAAIVRRGRTARRNPRSRAQDPARAERWRGCRCQRPPGCNKAARSGSPGPPRISGA